MTRIRVLAATFTAMMLGFACSGDSGSTSNATTGSETTSPTTSAGPDTTTSTSGVTSSGTTAQSGSETNTGGTTAETTSVGMTSSTSSATTAETTQGVGECTPKDCNGMIYACGDCEDNDDDGLIDLADPECISHCDDREDAFASGLPGDNMDPCNQDCFFDGNSGAGDDKCNWNLKCDPENPGGEDCPYDPDWNNCPEEQDLACLENCAVPNGCDCFGCCAVSVNGMDYNIYLGDEDCSIANIEQCEQCTINTDCDDDCDPEMCEVCFGQDPDDLPPECDGNECDEGEQPCTVDNMGNDDCPDGFFCFVNCCVQEIG